MKIPRDPELMCDERRSMNIEEALYSKLTGDAGVAALVSTRIYPNVVPQDIALPAVAYQRISTVRDMAHDGPTGVAHARFQFTVSRRARTAAPGTWRMRSGRLWTGFTG